MEERLSKLLEENLELTRNVLWAGERLEIQVEELVSILFEDNV